MLSAFDYMTEEECMARIYCETNIAESGISFAQFMVNPNYYLVGAGQDSALECMENGFEPLLPRQASIAKKLREQGF